MHHKLNPLQGKYLSEIGSMLVSHTTKENSNYHLAEELEKIGFLKLIESDSPLIRTVLTDTGKEHIKTRKELIEKKLIGEEDCQMNDGNYTDRYETLNWIKKDRLIEGKCTIYESDKIKGTRITIVDKDAGAIIRETK
jgi:hypothetical protein